MKNDLKGNGGKNDPQESLLIYCEKISNRIKYIFGLFFDELLGIKYRITSDHEAYLAHSGPSINYAKKPLEKGIFICSDGILFERGIRNHELSFINYDGNKAFFPTFMKQSAFPFDLFAAAFYLVTRYEEYLPYMKDEYGRFSAKESLPYREGFLEKPLVNLWADKLKEVLLSGYPEIRFKPRKFRFIPTVDVDAAYAYKQKGWFRTLGGYINSLSRFEFPDMAQRTRVLAGMEKDPFDTFEYHLDLQKKYGLRTIYFILFAEYGLNDKNISVRNRKFQRLIKMLADYSEIGIHPSFASSKNSAALKTEVERLSAVLNREITKSRQHFLMLNLPETYRNLINLDIREDYSMGFASMPGFRAGICDPHYFYDLDLDTKTPLRIYPFALMDGTLRDYMDTSNDKAMEHISRLIGEVKKVNGTFISIWHNESLSDQKRWKGWRTIYEELIKTALR